MTVAKNVTCLLLKSNTLVLTTLYITEESFGGTGTRNSFVTRSFTRCLLQMSTPGGYDGNKPMAGESANAHITLKFNETGAHCIFYAFTACAANTIIGEVDADEVTNPSTAAAGRDGRGADTIIAASAAATTAVIAASMCWRQLCRRGDQC